MQAAARAEAEQAVKAREATLAHVGYPNFGKSEHGKLEPDDWRPDMRYGGVRKLFRARDKSPLSWVSTDLGPTQAPTYDYLLSPLPLQGWAEARWKGW